MKTQLTRNDEVELSIAFSSVPVKVAELVNEDGSVTAAYWEFWRSIDGAGALRTKTNCVARAWAFPRSTVVGWLRIFANNGFPT